MEIYSPSITDIRPSSDQAYAVTNAFDGGTKLPDALNKIIGYGSYAPMNQSSDIHGRVDIAKAEGFAKINSAIFLSLSTPLGTRFMNPGFGSTLYKLLFEPYDQMLINAIIVTTREALEKDVHSIEVKDVNVDSSQYMYNLLKIRIDYKIINTPLSSNYVYPFVISPEPTKY